MSVSVDEEKLSSKYSTNNHHHHHHHHIDTNENSTVRQQSNTFRYKDDACQGVSHTLPQSPTRCLQIKKLAVFSWNLQPAPA